MRHTRIRKSLKWGGLVATLAAAAVWIDSGFSTSYYAANNGSIVALSGGDLVVVIKPTYRVSGSLPKGWRRFGGVVLERTWSFDRLILPGYFVAAPINLPLGVPVMLMAIGLAGVWFIDLRVARRVAAGHCPRCDYQLTHLRAFRCPECGWAPTRPTLTCMGCGDALSDEEACSRCGCLPTWAQCVEVQHRRSNDGTAGV